MRKIIVVARREFREKVRNRGFVLTSIGPPLLLLILWGVGGFGAGMSEAPAQELANLQPPDRPIGYVDQAGLIRTIPDPVPPDLFQPYPDVASAEAALRVGQLAAYYRVPPDYRETGEVYRVSAQLPTVPPDTQLFNWILVGNLLPQADAQQVARLRQPFNAPAPEFVNVAEPEGQAGGGRMDVLPLMVTVAVIVPLFTSGGYLFQTLAQEKQGQIMEVLLSSLRPHEMLAGKLLGLGALTVVQYGIWAALVAMALAFTGRDLSALLSRAHLSAGEALWAIPFALGGFVLYAALMAGLGAVSSDMERSRIWVFIITLPMVVPMWFWTVIAGDPGGPLATALSLIPFSAPVAMLMRMTSTAVPLWQLTLSVLLLLLAGVMTVWLMARLFRVQTLLSGEPFSVGRAWSALVR